jgi:hypothetical protein
MKQPATALEVSRTPLVRSIRWPGLWWKLEGFQPSGSMWARAAARAVEQARAQGSTAVRWAGHGDACSAVATFAAAAGLGAELQVQGELCLADRVRIELVRAGGGGTELDRGAWLEGLASLGRETVEQLGRLPGAVLWPGATEVELQALRTGLGGEPRCEAPGPTEGWAGFAHKTLQAEGVWLSREGASGALRALELLSQVREVVVIDPRDAAKHAEHTAAWLGVRKLPGRLAVGGIITPV